MVVNSVFQTETSVQEFQSQWSRTGGTIPKSITKNKVVSGEGSRGWRRRFWGEFLKKASSVSKSPTMTTVHFIRKLKVKKKFKRDHLHILRVHQSKCSLSPMHVFQSNIWKCGIPVLYTRNWYNTGVKTIFKKKITGVSIKSTEKKQDPFRMKNGLPTGN